MASDDLARLELLQGNSRSDRASRAFTMGPQHAYGLAVRPDQLADHPFSLNQGTVYLALVGLGQHGWINGAWQTAEAGHEAKYYLMTRSAPARWTSRPRAGNGLQAS